MRVTLAGSKTFGSGGGSAPAGADAMGAAASGEGDGVAPAAPGQSGGQAPLGMAEGAGGTHPELVAPTRASAIAEPRRSRASTAPEGNRSGQRPESLCITISKRSSRPEPSGRKA